MDLKHSDYHRGYLINVYKEGRIYRVKITSNLSKEITITDSFDMITDAINAAKQKIDLRFKSVD